MKKTYNRPSFKSIMLDANGTGTGACEEKVASWGFETCAVEIDPGLFVYGGPNEVSECTVEPDAFGGICYGYFGQDGGVVFGS